MVKLTKIYTKTGDEGKTSLGDFSRVPKTDSRIEALADVDEANSAIGVAVALAHGEFEPRTIGLLQKIQNDLFDLGADLCFPLRSDYAKPPLRVNDDWVVDLEQAIDNYNADLAKLDSFIIPGGTALAAALHLARTVVRRAERATWRAIEIHGIDMVKTGHEGGGVNLTTAKYLNRLSDLLFVLARTANANSGGDVKWTPFHG